MKYTSIEIPIGDKEDLLRRFYQLCLEEETALLLNSNGYPDDAYSKYDIVLGLGVAEEIKISGDQEIHPFEKLQNWLQKDMPAMGYFSYDVKNHLEDLRSENTELMEMPDLYFFIPEEMIRVRGDVMELASLGDPHQLYNRIFSVVLSSGDAPASIVNCRSVPDEVQYKEDIHQIKEHIRNGDIYEMNYCRYFEGDVKVLNVPSVFHRLMALAKAPFSSLFKYGNKYVLCASPERFLCKRNHRLITQPIKGTIARGSNAEEDLVLQKQLYNSTKDRAEHIMIVDLCRNDLSRSCIPGTVTVDELFGVYTFETVSHMISTISGMLNGSISPLDALRFCFPMGSMTGAPKVRAMELIEKYEHFKRGIFSGAIGYFDEGGDFDFNVVIRTILYDQEREKVFVPVGGAIVYDSDPDDEYAESFLKAKTILKTLNIRVEDIL